MIENEVTLKSLLLNWKVLATVAVVVYTVVLYSFVALVNAMHTPTPADTPRYRFWFKVAHSLSGQLTRAGLVKDMPRISTGTVVDVESPFRPRKNS